MVEELKLAIKIDDNSIEQSLLKQFTNAQKMADKVVLDFKNVNFDDKEIEAKFKALQKKAGQNPIDLSISKDSINMLYQVSDKLGDIFKISQGKSIIDSSSTIVEIDKIKNAFNIYKKEVEEYNKVSEKALNLSSKLSKKLSNSNIKNQQNGKRLLDLYDNNNENYSNFTKESLNSYLKKLPKTKKDIKSFMDSTFSEIRNINKKSEISDLQYIMQDGFNFSDVDSDTSKQKIKYIQSFKDEYLNEWKSLSSGLENTKKEIKPIINSLLDALNIKTDNFKIEELLNKGTFNKVSLKNIEDEPINNIRKSFDQYSNDSYKNFNLIDISDIKNVDDLNQKIEGLISRKNKLDDDWSKQLTSTGVFNSNLVEESNLIEKEIIAYSKLNTIIKENKSITYNKAQNNSVVDDSQIKELKSDIQEVKTELGDVKARISTIESNGFENVRDDVEKTKESVKELNSELAEMKSNLSSTPQESNISSGMKDAFPNADTKLDEAVTSAKDLDKTLEQVDIPTDSFDKVLEKLDRTKSELVDIVKITKQSVSDADGKFHDSYTLKDSRGSTEIYGVNSKTDKGQILRQNIVGYDKKKDELDISKAQLEVDKQLAKEEDNLAKAQQKKAQAFLKEQANYEEDQKKAELIKRQTLAYDELTDTISKYSEVAKRVAGGNAEDGDLELMTKLEDKISKLQKQPILSDSQVSKSEKSLVSLYDQLDKIERKLVETNQKSQDKQIVGFDKRLESYTKKTSGYDATIARFNDGGWTSDIYLKNVQAVKDAVKQYATLLDNINTNQNGIASDEDIQNLDKYEKKIKNTIATVTNMSAAEKGYSQLAGQKEIDKINKILRENSAMSSEAKAKIKAYKQELISGNPSVSLEKIHGEIMKIVNAEELAGRAGRSMFDVIKEKAFYGFAAQIGMYFGFNDIVNGFKQVASTVIDLNTQITDLAKVSEATSSQIYDDFSSYADIAKDIGGTISDTISATADWSRNGYNLPDSKELARVALLYKNVGDGIDIDTANESLISTLRGFKMEADEAEKIIDIFNNVSNNEPIDSGGIGEALQRSAASFNAANTSLQESVALISTTNSVIQNPEKVGNMWKVVSMRIRSATSELEQAGEDTDGLVTSTADLQKMIKAMTGYDILESDGKTFKSIYDIVLNISKVWNNLSDLDQSSLLQALAGVTTKMFARIYRNINHRIYLIARVA